MLDFQEENKNTRFRTRNECYQPDDFKFSSLMFGKITAPMYSARKVTRENMK